MIEYTQKAQDLAREIRAKAERNLAAPRTKDTSGRATASYAANKKTGK